MSSRSVLLDDVNSRSPHRVPGAVHRQLQRATRAFRRVLGRQLQGLYLHGSLAMGGFDARRSDLDLLGVCRRRLSNSEKRKMIEAMLSISGSPRPIVMSIVAHTDLVPWRHPAPFQLCWSEDWRGHYRQQLNDGTWRRWEREHPRDGDLAAHVAMTRVRGRALFGPPPAAVLPFVPESDLVQSLTSDGRWALRLLRKHPAMARYAVLNACRRQALVRRGFLLSKVEGADWAMEVFGAEWRGVIQRACQGRSHPATLRFLRVARRLELAAVQQRGRRQGAPPKHP